MNQLTSATTQDYEPQFDVFVSWNKVTPLEEIKERAQRLNAMTVEKADALVNALSTSATLCIGKGATKERADAAKAKMIQLGLAVELRQSLWAMQRSVEIANEITGGGGEEDGQGDARDDGPGASG